MPPKAKFTRQEIVTAAIQLTEREGETALTARALASVLGGSSRPIFTRFCSMEEVCEAVNEAVKGIYGEYIESGLSEELAFRGVGRAYIRFAAERPVLFQMLFMRERTNDGSRDRILQGIEEHYERILQSIVTAYHLSRKRAQDLYFHLWVYSHGIAVLIATRTCAFSSEQITAMLSEVCLALLSEMKKGEE